MRIKAYTLVELLITLIVIGITMLIILGSVEIAMKYLRQKQVEVYDNIDKYNNYMVFLDVVHRADSISFDDQYLRFYREKEHEVKVEHLDDKYLIINHKDTLLDNVYNIRVNVDTLSVWLTTLRDSLCQFDYVVGEKYRIVDWDNILKQEQKYMYDD